MLPNYMLDQNAVLRDEGVTWRHGSVPDYSMANAAFETGEPQPACLVKQQAFASAARVSRGCRNRAARTRAGVCAKKADRRASCPAAALSCSSLYQ